MKNRTTEQLEALSQEYRAELGIAKTRAEKIRLLGILNPISAELRARAVAAKETNWSHLIHTS